MTEILMAVEPQKEEPDEKTVPAASGEVPAPGVELVPADPVVLSTAGPVLLRGLVRRARTVGGDLTGPDGLLKQLTKTVIESALEEELTDHLGYDKQDPLGHNGG